MQIRLAASPFADGHDLSDFLRAAAADPELLNLDIVVAWAKRSGLDRISGILAEFGARGGQRRILLGISEGGATRQGLELARSLFDSAHVFHDRTGRTFHPKLYLAWGKNHARLLVGSQNATAGGVFFNYELGLDCELVFPNDRALFDQVTSYIARLYSEAALCKELTEEVLTELVTNPLYKVGDEDSRRSASSSGPEEVDDDIDTVGAPNPPGSRPSLFSLTAERRKADPAPPGRTTTQRSPRPSTSTPAGRPPRPVSEPQEIVKRWYRHLDSSNAQRPTRDNTNPTGALRLTKNRVLPLDVTTYFRNDLFGKLLWAGEEGPKGLVEHAIGTFSVTIDGADVGVHNLRIDNAAYKESRQHNFTATLHWDSLAPVLRQNDYTDWFVVIELLADGTYRLEITRNDPGVEAFLP